VCALRPRRRLRHRPELGQRARGVVLLVTHLAREGRVTVTIGRRELLAALGGAAAWPLAARAQQPGKIRAIGLLSPASRSPSVVPALFDALAKLGWIEGKNLVVERRYAENRPERLPELAAELVRLNVDVIVATGTLGPLAAKQATSTIPIVMTASGDQLGSGLVASLARPRPSPLEIICKPSAQASAWRNMRDYYIEVRNCTTDRTISDVIVTWDETPLRALSISNFLLPPQQSNLRANGQSRPLPHGRLRCGFS
jgi:hypothetical protein